MSDTGAVNPCPAPIDPATYQYTGADNTFIMMCAALVMIMTPGLGYYYSGMARSKNALTLIMLCFLAYAVVTVQWYLIGFSLTFSDKGGKLWGDCTYCFLRNIGQNVLTNIPSVPTVTFAFYELMFAALTPALIFGSTAERVRILPAGVFVFLWSTFVYSPIAYWAWSANGWANQVLGYLDFAGGTPVHTSSGFAGLAFAVVIGRRKHTDDFVASSMANVFLGTALLWFGWFGFNGGSEVASNARSANAMMVTNIAAATGGLVWMLVDYLGHRKVSGLGFCSGAVAGLVGITPASGFVSGGSAFAIGAITALVCNTMVRLKAYFLFDDTLDAFNVHGIGGVTGAILTGVFAQRSIKALNIYPSFATVDPVCIASLPPLGWLDGNWAQVGKQLASASAGAGWSFFATCIIVAVMQRIPGLRLRVPEEAEVIGSDQTEMGEVSYDYVEALSAGPAGGSLAVGKEASEVDLMSGGRGESPTGYAYANVPYSQVYPQGNGGYAPNAPGQPGQGNAYGNGNMPSHAPTQMQAHGHAPVQQGGLLTHSPSQRANAPGNGHSHGESKEVAPPPKAYPQSAAYAAQAAQAYQAYERDRGGAAQGERERGYPSLERYERERERERVPGHVGGPRPPSGFLAGSRV
ncbi:ammonium transporter [Gonapodya prolifera JEL478]|uniref:Ammonium transporter n=1 Tax=Gonapodya prolifera (strain JEL478) TaxID=1344416 RepID=A0A139ATW2_GONPJ|nr:ammonium transporter [Gonapodya prolifera JEL478]|eukprot:KXS20186.1 ammonium transporter [Gonapodya prolifera JEL478]